MNVRALARACALGLSAALASGGGWDVARAQGTGNVERGRKLFERVWTPNLPSREGDGLGPLYNERSCVACHLQGGVGGAGPTEHNVELLTAIEAVPAELKRIHRGFGQGTSTVLHRYGTASTYPAFRHGLLRHSLAKTDPLAGSLFMATLERTQTAPPIQLLRIGKTKLFVTRRNTTPLFGAGQIDSISDKFLEQLGREQSLSTSTVKGRFVGRFGWRGQVLSLREFVLGACAVELGLEVPGHAQAIDPQRPNHKSPGQDLNLVECDDLITYVASLPPPRRELPDDGEELAAVENGARLFDGIGCADCHRAKLADVEGLYSDLLLHDMGPRLDDPAIAPGSVSKEYYGPPPNVEWRVAGARRREWKTPPLWGLRDSAPYLHDGRAATIEEAVLWHGGEAGDAQVRYLILDHQQQAQVIAFLSTLAAPREPLTALAAPRANTHE
jgi:CxxC motif-containing protein (DUF1111 family)